MEDFNSETDSDYTSYWRDWVSLPEGFLSCWTLRCAGLVDGDVLLRCIFFGGGGEAIEFVYEDVVWEPLSRWHEDLGGPAWIEGVEGLIAGGLLLFLVLWARDTGKSLGEEDDVQDA
jgi:hypothetical protein